MSAKCQKIETKICKSKAMVREKYLRQSGIHFESNLCHFWKMFCEFVASVWNKKICKSIVFTSKKQTYMPIVNLIHAIANMCGKFVG